MSRSVVFNESAMYFDKLSSDVSASSDEEQIRVEVEHSTEKEIVTEDNDGDASDNSDSDNDNMPDSSPVMQQQNLSIAAGRQRRNCGPRPCLIEECNIVNYALSCAEQVEHRHEPSTYTEAVGSGDREK